MARVCQKCIEGRHLRCHDSECLCDICSHKVGRAPTVTRRRIGRRGPYRVKAKRESVERVAKPRQQKPPKETNRTRNVARFGFGSELDPELVAKIIEWGETGRGSISEAARTFDVSRDHVRTVYRGRGIASTYGSSQLSTSDQLLEKSRALFISASTLMSDIEVKMEKWLDTVNKANHFAYQAQQLALKMMEESTSSTSDMQEEQLPFE